MSYRALLIRAWDRLPGMTEAGATLSDPDLIERLRRLEYDPETILLTAGLNLKGRVHARSLTGRRIKAWIDSRD